jgi:predicted TIM-barrel fold metal-dependent hydrolase
VNPDRLIPLGVIPVAGIDAAIKELEYCAKAGFKGIQLDRYPSGKPFPAAEDDRFWEAALALKMPITHHCGSGSTRMAREDEPTFEYKKSDSPDRAGGFFARDPMRPWFFRYTFEGIVAPVQLAMAGVYQRFPDLQIYWGETLIGWLPSTLVQVQSNYERYKHLARDQFGFDFLEEPIVEYVKQHNLWGFLSDPHGIRMRHDIGVDTIMWGSDFAHAAGDWPYSLKQIEREYADVPEDEKRAMLGGNAIRFFHLD